MKIRLFIIIILLVSNMNIIHSAELDTKPDISLDDCDPIMMNAGDIYWCLIDKYHKSALLLQETEKKAESKLIRMDKEAGFNVIHGDKITINYDTYIHQARQEFPALHKKFILYRQQQCSFMSLRLGTVPGSHHANARLYCLINMNLTQIKWIRDAI